MIDCTHWWVIGPEEHGICPSTCRYCHQERDFPTDVSHGPRDMNPYVRSRVFRKQAAVLRTEMGDNADDLA